MEINLQPILEDEFLVLRPLTKNDFEDLYAVASDPKIWEQHQVKNRYTLDEFTNFFNGGIASKGAFAILDKNSNQIIGSSRYKLVNATEGVVEIGWSFLSKEYWGGEYNRKFKKLMINHILEYCNLIVFYVDANNLRSQKAMEKVGGWRIEDDTKTWVRPLKKGLTYVIDEPIT